jgi:hypothetical protein
MRDNVAPLPEVLERVDTLILLVGGNPLPNAVSAKALLADGGHVVLIESRETKSIAERLVRYLKREQVSAGSVERRCVEPDDPRSVRLIVNCILRTVPSDHRVGLNYTGGTKVMVAHSYCAVREWAKENHRSVQFSYLSPDGLRMVVEPHDECMPCARFSLGQTVSISFEDLLKLHDWELANAPRRSGTGLRELIPELVRIQGIQAERQDWRNTVTKPLGEAVKRANSAYQGRSTKAATYDEEAGRGQLGFPTTHRLAYALAKAVGTGRSDCQVTADFSSVSRQISMGQAAKNSGLETAWNLWRWMNGGWLEECAFLALTEISEECGLHDVTWNAQIRARRSQGSGHETAQFEIDCVAMRGYQVFVVSCTTDSSDSMDKSKLFEAHMRATQLGGDEARFALVCTSDRPGLVKEECRRDLLTEGQAPVEVFGARDLESLPEKLRNWILG